MLTICIPVYQKIVYSLINELQKQSGSFGSKVKIVVLDDASDARISEINKKNIHESVDYVVLKNNIGRSRIRNHFLAYTKTPYLLFLDGDIVVRHADFVARYMHLIEYNNSKVVCGGHNYAPNRPTAKYLLRWKYGHMRETIDVQVRREKPYKSFKTSNFLISREVLSSIRFNENITSYGHEDTLFGFELKIRQIDIVHIDNPVYVEHYDTNKQFLDKVALSISNLAYINNYLQADSRFLNDVKLLSWIYKIKHRRCVWLFRTISLLFLPLTKLMLQAGCASMRILDLYKLTIAFRSDNYKNFFPKASS